MSLVPLTTDQKIDELVLDAETTNNMVIALIVLYAVLIIITAVIGYKVYSRVSTVSTQFQETSSSAVGSFLQGMGSTAMALVNNYVGAGQPSNTKPATKARSK
jgi:Kef-type K+ transport system membrane component KefB